jgi:xylulose-5-phosphate/fructose-6-phosphate phosphoketolase
MGANPHANGGTLRMPAYRDFAVQVSSPGSVRASATGVLGSFVAEVMRSNLAARNFRVFGPDETASNRLGAVIDVSGKAWMAEIEAVDVDLSADGRVMDVLSEHLCEGWLEGYLLTGRHGLFSCYEAFIHIIDSMFNQHAKWLKVCKDIPWRAPIASLNYLLTSHVWRQDHNGFSHQDPGFIDHVANKNPDVVRIYLAPDANCLLSIADHCLRSTDYVNLMIAGKQPEWQWLDIESAALHCAVGAGIWSWAGHGGEDPDVVMACAGDVPTLEMLAAVMLLREYVPDMRIRVRGQCGRPDGAAAVGGASARPGRRRLRRDVHARPAHRVRLPRVSVAHPQAYLSSPQPREAACARLQGRGHYHHAVRHGGAESHGPLPARARRDLPHSAAGRAGRRGEAEARREHCRPQGLDRRTR